MTYPVKIEFKDYPSGSWIDWSDYLVDEPTINKRVESENEGEAGVIVFDNASVSFRYDSGNPVYTALSGDLSSKQRYLFRISAPKSNKNYVQLFEGVADFSTIRWTELDKVISFEIIDKLSALGVIPAELARVVDTLNARVLAQQPTAQYLSYGNFGDNIIYLIAQDAVGIVDLDSPVIFAGEVIADPQTIIDGSPVYYVVVKSEIVVYTDPGGDKNVNKVTLAPDHNMPGQTFLLSDNNCKFWEKELWTLDCNNITADVLQSLDGLKVIQALYNQCWSGVTPLLKPDTLTFPIPLEYAIRLVTEEPLGGSPLDAIKTLANTMKCYIYINSAGNLVIHSKNNLGTTGTARMLGTTKIISKEKNYFWDKLVDGVTVNITSWVLDGNGEYLGGTSTQTKQITGINAFIKPKNEITKDLLTPDSDENTQELLDARAATEAAAILAFYGNRRSSYELTLDLDDNILGTTEPWELVDNIDLPSEEGGGGGSVTYFFTGIEIDLAARTVSLTPVEVTGHEYDFRQVVVGLSESNSVSVSSSAGSGSGGGGAPINYTGGDLTLTGDLFFEGDNRKIFQTENYSLSIGTNNLERIKIAADGKIACGTTDFDVFSTAAKLRVLTAVDDDAGGVVLDNRYGGASDRYNLGLKIRRTGWTPYITWGLISDYADASLKVVYENAGSEDFSNSPSVPLTILTTGNIGIGGATNPIKQLVVWGNSPEVRISDRSQGEDLKTWGIGLLGSNFRISTLDDSESSETVPLMIGRDGKFTINNSVSIGTYSVAHHNILSIRKPSQSGFNYDQFGGAWRPAVQLIGNDDTADFLHIISPQSTDPNYNHTLFLSSHGFDFRPQATHTSPGGAKIFFSDDGKISFDDIASYFYSPSGVNDLVFVTNDIETIRMRNGNVGIGVGNAVEKLELSGHFKHTGNWSLYNNFTSGWTGSGWRIDYNISSPSEATVEADNMFLRGTLSVYELLIQQIRATNGTVYVTACGKIKSVATQYLVTVEDPSGHNIAPFLENDILIVQRVNLDSTIVVKRVIKKVVSIAGTVVGLADLTGAPANVGQLEAGDDLIRIGNTTNTARQGSIYLTSDDSNAPFFDIIDDVASWDDWRSTAKLKARMGKLTGITDSDFGGTLPGYGIYMSGSAFIKGNIVVKASNQLSLQNTSIMMGNITGTANNAIKISQTGTTSTSGIFLYDSSAQELLKFALDGTRHIANWYFDNEKFYRQSSSSKFALNTSATAYIGASQKGFEVFDIASPKVFVGLKSAGGALEKGFDWNFTTADEMTVKATLLSSRFSTKASLTYAEAGLDIQDNYIKSYYDAAGEYYIMVLSPTKQTFYAGTSYETYEEKTNLYPGYLEFINGASQYLKIYGNTTFGNRIRGLSTLTLDTVTSGDIKLSPVGNLVLDPVSNFVLPETAYDINIGSSQKKYLSLSAAELVVETLVASNVMATIGGRIVVAPTNQFVAPLASGGTTIYVKYNNFSNGDVVRMEEGGKVEFMRITSSASVWGSYWSYSVTRDLDGSGANNWYEGDAIVSLQNGFIDLYAYQGMKSSSQVGPSIVGSIRNSSTYNDWSEAWAIGNLGGLYGQSSGTFGVGLGKYANNSSFILIDNVNGIQFKRRAGGNDSIIAQYGMDGDISLGYASSYHTYISANDWRIKYGDTTYLDLSASGIVVGTTTYFNTVITSTNIQLKKGSSVHLSISDTQLTVGVTTGFHTRISSSGVEIKNDTTVLGSFGSSIVVGESSAGRNIQITSTDLNFRLGSTNHLVMNAAGILIGQATGSIPNIVLTSGALDLRKGTDIRIHLASDGSGYLADGSISWASGGALSLSGNITSAATITGGTIQTAGSGQRVVLGSNQISFYDSDNYNVGHISGIYVGGAEHHLKLTAPVNTKIVLQSEWRVDIDAQYGAFINGYAIATQSWVAGQGYLTSLPSHQHSSSPQQFVAGISIDGQGHVIDIEYGIVTVN